MPPDIRSFFGGGSGGASNGVVKPAAQAKEKDSVCNCSLECTKLLTLNPQTPKKTGRGRPRKIVSDDEDEEVEDTQPKKATPIRRKPAKDDVKEEETTSSAYFASNKPKSGKASTNSSTQTPKKAAAATNSKSTTPGSARRSARKSASKVTYAEDSDEDTKMKLDDTKDGGDDDIHADDYKTGRHADDYEDSEDDAVPLRPTKGVNSKKPAPKDDESDLEMTEVPGYDGGADSKRTTTRKPSARKRKVDDDDEDEEDETPKKKAKKSTPTTKKPRAKKDEEPENTEVSKLLDSIGTIRPPTPPPRDESRKFNYRAGGGNVAAGPTNPGTKTIPWDDGAENCLTGLTFVFTGVLQSIGREDAISLVKKYGGKTTTGPSKKTSYVVIGDDAGPKKLETIRNLGVKTINEDQLFKIITTLPANGGDSKAAAESAAKKAAAEEKLKQEAIEMEKREKERQKKAEQEAKASAAARGISAPAKPTGPKVDDRLWVDKYAPDSTGSVCGNKGQVEKLQNWLRTWHKRQSEGFKKAGADGTGIYRAAMLHGPPGIGKTTAAHLVAKLEGFDVVESNASDTRSKKLVETGLKGVLDTTSLLGFFAGDGKKVDSTKKKLVLIMDEVDGMSAGDRGGVGAMAAIAKKTNIPMILICNDRRLPKMKPFDFVTADMPFRRPTTDMIRSRIMTICYKEKLKLPTNVIDAIIEGSNADIRQIINMISTIKLDAKQMDYKEGKAMSKAWEKHVILKPWDIVNKILRAEMFSPASTATLNDKIELYFNDHEFSYLMLQENYLKTKMARPTNVPPKKMNLKLLELAESAAESISDGDLVDRMIHGSQQQWSLMPTHAVFSFVRPASFVYGNLGGQVGFTSWLGNNSKQGKLSRIVKEIQGHMRLKTSANVHEIREQYMSALWSKTIGLMKDQGKDSVPEVIDFMDSYYLTKDDYDGIAELGVGPLDQEKYKIETQTKATFTRMYNAQDHPMPFIKASAIGNAAAKSSAPRAKPDLEEAVDESEGEAAVDGALEAADEGEEEDLDLKKDKYVKVPKKKAAPKGKAAAGGAKGKGKAKKEKDEDEGSSESEEEPKPKKKTAATASRGGGAGRGRGRGRGKG